MFFKTLPCLNILGACGTLLAGCTTTPVYQQIHTPTVQAVAKDVNQAKNYVYQVQINQKKGDTHV